MKAKLFALLAVLIATHAVNAVAGASGQGSVVCHHEQAMLDELNTRAQVLRVVNEAISAVFDGSAPATLSPAALEELLSREDGESAPVAPVPELHCETLREDYAEAHAALVWQSEQLSESRQRYWHGLPAMGREVMLNLWASRNRLLTSAQAVRDAFPGQDLPAVRDAANVDELLRIQRRSFVNRLPGIATEVDAARLQQWLEQWQHALQLQQALPQPVITASMTAAQRDVLAHHHRLARLDALVISRSFDAVRAWLWQEYRAVFRSAVTGPEANGRLLLGELRALRNSVQWLYLDALTLSRTGEVNGSVSRRLFLGFEYLSGLLALAALAFVATRVRQPASRWQGSFARKYRGNRARAQVVRATSGIPELLPWLLGWLGLNWLEGLFQRYDLVLLVSLLPFARLYIVYGLLCLAGEWFIGRMAELSGSYLSAEQQRETSRRARRFAGIVVLPWLLKDIIGIALGPSLSLLILDWLTLVAILVALGLLLRPWQREFVRALQSFLPAAMDGWCERAFSGTRFVLLAPLAAIPMLFAMMLFFLHKGLVHFDWYRKAMARLFKLRSGTVGAATADAVESDAQALAAYAQWFSTEEQNEELPVISVELAQAVQDRLEAWLDDRSEENSLLLSGERGSGKTTLLRQVQGWLMQQEEPVTVQYLEVPAKTTTATAVAALLGPVLGVDLSDGPAGLVKSDETRTPTVVILDNAQNFFLRDVDGLAGWESLLALTRSRLRNLFWVVTINNQSWAYVGNVFGRQSQFNSRLRTRPWSQNEIRSLILSRNQLSKYRIEYDSILMSSRGPEAGNIRNAEQLYFSLLWDVCGGNPGIALPLWLSSITVVGNTVTVGLPLEVSGAALEQLDDDQYFVFASLVLHENMTSEEAVRTTAMPESLVRSALKKAFDIGFVEASAQRRYRIVPIWYRTVVRLLARKNLLHE